MPAAKQPAAQPAASPASPAKKAAPAKKAGPATKAAPKKTATAAPEPAVEPTDATGEPTDATETADGEPEAPLNRAERRARGKGKASTQPSARGKVVGGHGPAQAQRMWANRRSG